ncbi:MAG: RlmE family RNA methyltransferase [Magnetococcales bacterium]|nr:RlmE family RNA methyltransferase [Magnetococcales bacterium]
MSKRRPSSGRWLEERRRDPYIQAAQAAGYRSRAAFKLLEIQEQVVRSDQGGPGVVARGMTVLDLGAAPGGWSQVAARLVGGGGRVVALDLLEMAPLEVAGGARVEVLRGDFLEEAGLALIREALGGTGRADLLLSDMAPEMCGIRSVDQMRGEFLAESVFAVAGEVLVAGGNLVLKLFQGPGFHQLVGQAKARFARSRVIKPPASRGRSPEHYLVGLGFRAEAPGGEGSPGGGVWGVRDGEGACRS